MVLSSSMHSSYVIYMILSIMLLSIVLLTIVIIYCVVNYYVITCYIFCVIYMLLCIWYLHRVSGVTDHYAYNDAHALQIARNIVANLNWKNQSVCNGDTVIKPPRYCASELGGIIPMDTKKPFDIRKVRV